MLPWLQNLLPQLSQFPVGRTLVYCSDWDGLMATFEMREGKEPSDFLQVSFHLLPLVSHFYSFLIKTVFPVFPIAYSNI